MKQPYKFTAVLELPDKEPSIPATSDVTPDIAGDPLSLPLTHYMCVTVPAEQLPDFLRGPCSRWLQGEGNGALSNPILRTLQQLAIPQSIATSLAQLPEGSILQVNGPPELIAMPFASMPWGKSTIGEYFNIVFVWQDEPRPNAQGTGKTLVVMKSTSSAVRTDSNLLPFPALDSDAVAGAHEVARLTQADTLYDDSVRRVNLQARIAQYSQVYFVTHGSLDPTEDNSTGFLVVATDPTDDRARLPGALTPDDIRDLPIPHDAVVTLAACESAVEYGPTDFDQSVAGAFLRAGARAVIATLWKVKSLSARRFMDEYYAQRKSGSDVETSYHKAQAILRTAGDLDAPAFILVDHWLL
jgi:CHAT domain-containing protein